MATAQINGTTLRRRSTTFTPRPKPGDPSPGLVTYYEALIFDGASGELYVFRSGTKSDLDGFEPGKPVKEAGVRVDKPTDVAATLVRPIRDDSAGGVDF